MSRAEWLRTFVAVYRSGSVTLGARSRGLSQPAASQQLAALSQAVGGPVLTRAPGGVAPTERGRDLYAQVAEPLDRLEDVLVGLDGGEVRRHGRPIRIGATAELFESRLLQLLAPSGAPMSAVFADDPRLVELVLAGDIDVAVVTAAPGRRTALDSIVAGERAYVLVSSPDTAPAKPFESTRQLGDWLANRAWATYSGERPVTRRFWTQAFGRPFDADVQLTAPDLRAVVTAVELGVGASLLPAYVCAHGLASGRLVELHDVSDLVPLEPWYAVTRRADAADPNIADTLARLTGTSPSSPANTPATQPHTGA